MSNLNRGTILSWFLAFVVVWFGVNEVLHPASWASLVPDFTRVIATASQLVSIHGILLILLGLALIFDYHRRVASGVISVMILFIIAGFLSDGSLSPVAVRDIGLFGMALALSFRS